MDLIFTMNTNGYLSGKGFSILLPSYIFVASIVFRNRLDNSRKRPPRELEKVVVTRAARLQECTLISDQKLKRKKLITYQSF